MNLEEAKELIKEYAPCKCYSGHQKFHEAVAYIQGHSDATKVERKRARRLFKAAMKVEDCLADMHTRPCKFDIPRPKDAEIECMACWAFEESNILGAIQEYEKHLSAYKGEE